MARLEEALKGEKPETFATFYDLIFLAMAQQKLGHAAEARDRLKAATKVLDAAKASNNEPLPWFARIAAERLRGEAEALINPLDGPAKP